MAFTPGVKGFAETPTTISETNVHLVDPFALANQGKVTLSEVELDFSDFRPSSPADIQGEAGCVRCRGGESDAHSNGVFYRPLESYKLLWSGKAGNGAATVLMPTPSAVFHLDVRRATFVRQTYSLTFQQGVPVTVALDKPSEAGAISSFPLLVVRSVAGLPTNIFQLKIDYSSKYRELQKAQLLEISNRIALIEAERNLQQTRTNASSSGNSPAQPQGGQGVNQ